MKKSSTKYWFLLLVLGIIFIVVGILVLLTPVESFITLATLFTFSFLLTGVFEISHALVNRKELDNWGWSLTTGLADLFVGILLLSRPGLSIALLPYFVGFGLMFRSMITIGWALFLRGEKVKDWSNLLLIGILGVFFSFISLWNPLFAGLTIITYIALAFLMVGIFNIYLSFKLRRLKETQANL